MARHPKYPEARGLSLDDLGTPKKRSPHKRLSKAHWDKLFRDVDELKERKAWSEFTPKHLVGLYAQSHEMVYKVKPEEVRDSYRQAVSAAMRMLKNEFKGEPRRMIAFMQWFWTKTNKTNKWRIANHSDSDWRPGWRYQFSASPLVDYRIYLARKGGKIR